MNKHPHRRTSSWVEFLGEGKPHDGDEEEEEGSHLHVGLVGRGQSGGGTVACTIGVIFNSQL